MYKRQVIQAFLVLMLVPYFVSCSIGDKDVTATRVLRINYTDAYGSTLTQIMMQKGFLDDLLPGDVTVEWTNITGAADMRDSLITGRIDALTLTAPSVITALENDMPIVILSNSVFQSGMLYSNNPRIRTLDDIHETDKISVVSIGNMYHLSMMMASEEEFGDAGKFDTNYIALSYPDVFASIETSNDLDCVILGFPYQTKANQIESLVPMLDLTPYIIDYGMSGFFITSQQFYDNNPVIIEALIKAAEISIDYLNSNPAEAAQILSQLYHDIDPADIEWQIRSVPPVLEISESAYNKTAEFLFRAGMIPNPPSEFANRPNYDSIPKVP